MRFERLFLFVGTALMIGFFVGFAAGVENPPVQQDIQWETLLAGAAAILGGWMAYSGAVAPHREEKRKVVELYKLQVEDSCRLLCALDKSAPRFRERLRKAAKSKAPSSEQLALCKNVAESGKDLPAPPEAISDGVLVSRHSRLVREFGLWEREERYLMPWGGGPRIAYTLDPDIDRLFEQLYDFLRLLDDRLTG